MFKLRLISMLLCVCLAQADANANIADSQAVESTIRSATTVLQPTLVGTQKSRTEKRDSTDQIGGSAQTLTDEPFKPMLQGQGYPQQQRTQQQETGYSAATFQPTTVRYMASEAVQPPFYDGRAAQPSGNAASSGQYAPHIYRGPFRVPFQLQDSQSPPLPLTTPTHRYQLRQQQHQQQQQLKPAKTSAQNFNQATTDIHYVPFDAPTTPQQPHYYRQQQQQQQSSPPSPSSILQQSKHFAVLPPKSAQQQQIHYIIAIPLSYVRQLQQQINSTPGQPQPQPQSQAHLLSAPSAAPPSVSLQLQSPSHTHQPSPSVAPLLVLQSAGSDASANRPSPPPPPQPIHYGSLPVSPVVSVPASHSPFASHSPYALPRQIPLQNSGIFSATGGGAAVRLRPPAAYEHLLVVQPQHVRAHQQQLQRQQRQQLLLQQHRQEAQQAQEEQQEEREQQQQLIHYGKPSEQQQQHTDPTEQHYTVQVQHGHHQQQQPQLQTAPQEHAHEVRFGGFQPSAKLAAVSHSIPGPTPTPALPVVQSLKTAMTGVTGGALPLHLSSHAARPVVFYNPNYVQPPPMEQQASFVRGDPSYTGYTQQDGQHFGASPNAQIVKLSTPNAFLAPQSELIPHYYPMPANSPFSRAFAISAPNYFLPKVTYPFLGPATFLSSHMPYGAPHDALGGSSLPYFTHPAGIQYGTHLYQPGAPAEPSKVSEALAQGDANNQPQQGQRQQSKQRKQEHQAATTTATENNGTLVKYP